MRIGQNPAKVDRAVSDYLRPLAVIMPVYIPAETGWHEQLRDILHLSLRSIRLTTGDAATVTVVANGCARPVVTSLLEWQEAGLVDQALVDVHNRGKFDAVVPLLRTCYAPLVHYTDADVLFTSGWIDEVLHIFRAFPEAGSVAPGPTPAYWRRENDSTLAGALLKGRLSLRPAVDWDECNRWYARTVHGYTEDPAHATMRAKQPTVRRGDVTAAIGAHHIAFTMRREAAHHLPDDPARTTLGDDLCAQRLEAPVDRAGYWRLATPRHHAWHLGNRMEEWMEEMIAEVESAAERNGPPSIDVDSLPVPRRGRLPIGLRRLIARLLRAKKLDGLRGRLLGWSGRVVIPPAPGSTPDA
jgi:hypothetical protein